MKDLLNSIGNFVFDAGTWDWLLCLAYNYSVAQEIGG